MNTATWFSAIFGIAFIGALFTLAVCLIFFPRAIGREAWLILRVVLALAGAGLGAIFTGMLTVNLNLSAGVAIQAASGFALFIVIFFFVPREQRDRGLPPSTNVFVVDQNGNPLKGATVVVVVNGVEISEATSRGLPTAPIKVARPAQTGQVKLIARYKGMEKSTEIDGAMENVRIVFPAA